MVASFTAIGSLTTSSLKWPVQFPRCFQSRSMTAFHLVSYIRCFEYPSPDYRALLCCAADCSAPTIQPHSRVKSDAERMLLVAS